MSSDRPGTSAPGTDRGPHEDPASGPASGPEAPTTPGTSRSARAGRVARGLGSGVAGGVRATGRGVGSAARVTGRAGRFTVFQARRAARAEGADQSGLSRLIEMHAFNTAGDAAVAIALAGTLFFQVPTGEARGQVTLFLVLTMLPFAVVAPLIGPFLDRFSHGRRWAIGATMALRAFFCWVLAGAVTSDSALLFPAALGVLVASKAYGVTRAAAVPRLLPSSLTLVKANGRVSLSGIVGALVSAPIAALAATAGSEWALRYAFLLFVVATVLAILLPGGVDSSEGETAMSMREQPDPVPRPDAGVERRDAAAAEPTVPLQVVPASYDGGPLDPDAAREPDPHPADLSADLSADEVADEAGDEAADPTLEQPPGSFPDPAPAPSETRREAAWRRARERRSTRIPASVAFALRANCGPRWMSGFLIMFMAFLLRENPIAGWEDRPELLLGVVAGGAGIGNALGILAASLAKRIDPAVMVVVALLADAGMALLGALFYGLPTLFGLGLVAGLAQSLGKVSLDATIQESVPARVQASAFALSDTTLQLAWVVGGFVGIVLPLVPQLGLGLACAVLVAWSAFVLLGRPRSQADQGRLAPL